MHAGTTIDRLNSAFAGRYRLEKEIGVGGMATGDADGFLYYAMPFVD